MYSIPLHSIVLRFKLKFKIKFKFMFKLKLKLIFKFKLKSKFKLKFNCKFKLKVIQLISPWTSSAHTAHELIQLMSSYSS